MLIFFGSLPDMPYDAGLCLLALAAGGRPCRSALVARVAAECPPARRRRGRPKTASVAGRATHGEHPASSAMRYSRLGELPW